MLVSFKAWTESLECIADENNNAMNYIVQTSLYATV